VLYYRRAAENIDVRSGEQQVQHAGAEALDRLGALLRSLRARPALREKRPGIFYVKGRAFLHFHADRSGLFADLREADDWRRLPVNDPEDCKMLIARVDRALEPAKDRGFATESNVT
jgi:hypothetical protein